MATFVTIPRCPYCLAINQADRRERDYGFILEWRCLKCGCGWLSTRGSEWDIEITHPPRGFEEFSPKEIDYDVKAADRPNLLKRLLERLKRLLGGRHG